MSTQQPEALRLATTTPSLRGSDWCDKAAAELRRLHALNAELLEALKRLEYQSDLSLESADPARVAARKAIAKARGEE